MHETKQLPSLVWKGAQKMQQTPYDSNDETSGDLDDKSSLYSNDENIEESDSEMSDRF